MFVTILTEKKTTTAIRNVLESVVKMAFQRLHTWQQAEKASFEEFDDS